MGVSRVNAKGQTDERPPYSGQILWTLSGPFSWSSLATMLAGRPAGCRQAPLRYSTMQNLRQYHHHRVLHAVNTIISTDKIGPHARTLPPSAPLSLRLLTKISGSGGGDGDFLLCSVTGEGTTVAEVEVS